MLRIRKHRFEYWHLLAFFLILYDAFAVNASYYLALLLRFELHSSAIPARYLFAFYTFAPVNTVLSIIVLWCLRMYKSVWRFASYTELMYGVLSSIITTALHYVGITYLLQRMPITYFVIGTALQFVFVVGIRFVYRFIVLLHHKTGKEARYDRPPRIMIIGAGSAGQLILRDIKGAPAVQGRVFCFIDDNPNKIGRFIDGIPIVGDRNDILVSCEKYQIDKIYLAMPSATAEQRRDILNICNETGCELKNLPGIYQLVNGDVSVSKMKDVAIEDLLGREPISVDMTEIYEFLSDKTILITGGGGSIGSELARQVAMHGPRKLMLLDIYENNAYEIQQELKRNFPNLDLEVLIGSVRDSRRVDQIFRTYKPDIVFHAAAHKHVPLMEGSPDEAIKNNVLGTYKTAYAAMMNGCKRFVLISTDKAVNPTNIMGASKRMCEMIVQTFDQKIKAGKWHELPALHIHGSDKYEVMPFMRSGQLNAEEPDVRTEFVAVRFGNVLGSNGSVIPLFKKQIAEGGPVTVTHPDIIRYFMTIPEATSLVLQAGVFAKGGEIFVLDMGAPVKIDTLARNLIKLSGYKPDEDIKIQYTGLRPGEKLFEEKLMAEEGLRTTPNSLIHIGTPIPFDADEFLGKLNGLMYAAYANDPDIRELVQDIVSTYHPAGEHGSTNKNEVYESQIRQIV